eukprot:4044862-Pleurochrysis_carterae.AAC.4
MYCILVSSKVTHSMRSWRHAHEQAHQSLVLDMVRITYRRCIWLTRRAVPALFAVQTLTTRMLFTTHQLETLLKSTLCNGTTCSMQLRLRADARVHLPPLAALLALPPPLAPTALDLRLKTVFASKRVHG